MIEILIDAVGDILKFLYYIFVKVIGGSIVNLFRKKDK